MPQPDDPELKRLALDMGLLGAQMHGLTLGYGIYVCHGASGIRLMSHEFRHVQQYEAAGDSASFLAVYLKQVAKFGYENAPYEVDARAHEVDHD
ncbi:MAG: hypothetical protein M0T84_11235 [Betaproteobacteria bacterium]|nr:hypothetical protein [Betaproteobacteria bacterium]